MRRAKYYGVVRAVAGFLLVSLVLSGCSGTGSTRNESRSPANSPVQYAKTASNSNRAVAANTSVPRFEEPIGDGERYAAIEENPFLEASRAPLSTFSVDVDTAAYANVRRFVKDGKLPPKDAVRIEEMINYFDYDYPQPIGDVPFSVNTEVASAPWDPSHKLLLIGLQGKKMQLENAPPANLVFLIDVSGSMSDQNKLPLLKQGLRTLVDQLSPRDRVAIVVYAGASGLTLPSTSAARRGEIVAALNNLEAGGSTNGSGGIKLAYMIAEENFIKDGINRVILATDGDFNVGMTSDPELVSLIEAKRKSGVSLSVLGFGRGNLNDSMMEKLADKGNGNYAYIDTAEEARKALGTQVSGTLFTIAKDVKIQVEFNPAKVAGYRLIGYENRLLANRDFEDDSKDAGEIGAGHSVTALYEIVPAGGKVDNSGIGELKYGRVEPSETQFANELLTVKLRYKEPNGSASRLLTVGQLDNSKEFTEAGENLRFAAAVAGFGMVLRDSRYKGTANFSNVWQIANAARGTDLNSYRSEFLDLVRRADVLKTRG